MFFTKNISDLQFIIVLKDVCLITLKIIMKTILVLSMNTLIALSCGNVENASSPRKTYDHFCSHCGEGFNGSGYVKDSGGNTFKVSSSELESYPGHYCSNSCAIIG